MCRKFAGGLNRAHRIHGFSHGPSTGVRGPNRIWHACRASDLSEARSVAAIPPRRPVSSLTPIGPMSGTVPILVREAGLDCTTAINGRPLGDVINYYKASFGIEKLAGWTGDKSMIANDIASEPLRSTTSVRQDGGEMIALYSGHCSSGPEGTRAKRCVPSSQAVACNYNLMYFQLPRYD